MPYENYQGNAGLGVGTGIGVGSNPADFVVGDKAIENAFATNKSAQDQYLSVLADTEKNIAAADQAYNVKMFQQKVADRDYMFKAFIDGSAKVDDFVDQDNPALKQAREKYDDAYSKWAENINNPDAAKNFKKAKDYQDNIAARLATRFTLKKQQEDFIKTMPPGADKDAAQANLDKWLNAKDKDGRPALPTVWQKFSEFNPDTFGKQAVISTTPVKSKDGLYTYNLNSFDYPKTLQNITETTVSGEGADKSNQYLHAYWDTTPTQQEDLIKKSVEATAAYNKERNLTGDKAVQPIQATVVGVKPNGDKIYKLTDTPEQFAAKYLLLKNPTTSSGEEFNKEYAAYMVGNKNANANMVRAASYAKKINNDIAQEKDKGGALKEIYKNNILAQPTLLQSGPGGILNFSNLSAEASSPLLIQGKGGKIDIVKPFDAQPVYDQVDNDGKPTQYAKQIGWKGGYYKPQYIYKDTEITADGLKRLYEKQVLPIERANYTLDDFMRDGVAAGVDGGGFQVNYMGQEGGKITPDLFEGALMYLNNKSKDKGEDGGYEEP